MLKISFFILSVISFATQSLSAEGKTDKNIIAIFDYSNFGPPSMSSEFLGQSWWSWEASGSSDPNQEYAIKVVVYANIPLSRIKQEFPIDSNINQDYRYITLKKANEYLDRHIEENVIQSITNVLSQTKNKLADQLKE